MTSKNGKNLPVDIALPERILLENGTLFVVLPTIDALQNFWTESSSGFAYAAQGTDVGGAYFLRPYEWVFGSTKAAVVETAMRWRQMNISCRFYDWANEDPEGHAACFKGS